MIYIGLCLGVLLVGMLFATVVVRSYARKGMPTNIIPSGLIAVPVMSLAFGINFFANKLISFDAVSFCSWVVLPLVYSYVLYVCGKRSMGMINKIAIDAIFAMLLVISLPKGVFLFKGLFGSLELPQYADNLLFVPLAVYLLWTFKNKNGYDGFSPMFVAVMGLGLSALAFPYKGLVGEGLVSFGLIIGFSTGVMFAFNQYPARIPMTDCGTAPLVLVFLWYVMQYSSKGMVMVVPSVFSYILVEDLVSLFKKAILKIKFAEKLNIDPRQYYLQVEERGFRPDVILTYIMKWHLGLILVAFVVCDERVPYWQGLGMALMSGACIVYMLSRKGLKEPSLKEVTTDVFSELKSAYKTAKFQINKKGDGEKDDKHQ